MYGLGVGRAFVGIGANLGDREQSIRRAITLLGAAPGVEVVATSQLRETEPWGPIAQPCFLNGAAELLTDLEPHQLLATLLGIETELGRSRDGERWGPRTIDLDLLLLDGRVVNEPGLQLPHPRLHERSFVLEPLCDLDPQLDVPGHGRVSTLLAALEA